MNVSIQAILMRFPEYSEKILRQISDNEELKNICADYELCMTKLDALRAAGSCSDEELNECMEVKTELEQDVLKYLHW